MRYSTPQDGLKLKLVVLGPRFSLRLPMRDTASKPSVERSRDHSKNFTYKVRRRKLLNTDMLAQSKHDQQTDKEKNANAACSSTL
jgi:hypothetical protein